MASERNRKILLIAFIVVIVLVAVRATLPVYIQRYVNVKLDESPEYDGSVGDIDLSIVRGAYTISDVTIVKTTGTVPVPLFAAERVEFSVLWRALLNGAVVAEAVIERAAINIVDSGSEESQQTGANGKWLTILDDLVALRLDQVEVRDSELHFRNFETDPVVDIFLSGLNVLARNLSNSEDLAETMVASVEARAFAMEDSEVTVSMRFDPTPNSPTFDLNARLLDLPIMSVDNFISAYAPFDVEAGSLDVVAELAAAEGMLNGYVKPIVYDLEVFRWREDIQEDGDNPIKALWESLVGFMSEILQNQSRDQLASNIPISGEIGDPDTSILATIGNILRNAFVEAFQANFENTITLDFRDEAQDQQPANGQASDSSDNLADTPTDSRP